MDPMGYWNTNWIFQHRYCFQLDHPGLSNWNHQPSFSHDPSKASTRNLTGKGMRPDHLEMDLKKTSTAGSRSHALPVNGVYLAEPKQFMFKQVKQTSVSWSNHGVFVVIHDGNPWSKWICFNFNPNRWWPSTSIAQSNFWPWHKTISAYLFLHQET